MSTDEQDDKLGRFKADVQKDADVVYDQSLKANEDMRFVNVEGGMWEGFLQDSNLPARIKLELDLVSNFLGRFLGEWAENRIGVEYKSNDKKTSDADSDLLNGIYRSDFRQFSGKMATDQAVNEAATVGYGAFKLAAVFEDEEDPENDNQNIEWRPIYNAYNTVFWDQSSLRIDKRDARHCTELAQFTLASFAKEFPGKDAVSAYTPGTDIGSTATRGLSRSRKHIVYVASRYEVVKVIESVFVYNNLKTSEVEVYNAPDHELIKDELRADEFHKFVREREITRQTIEKTVFSGADILEDTKRVAGKHIPIIPVYAYRSYVDGSEWYRGLVRKLKDAARLFNMQVSQLAENAASAGQEVPIFDPSQINNDAMAAQWADKNNLPYLTAHALRDADGSIVQTGPIGYSRPPKLDESTASLMSIVPQYVQDATGTIPQEVLSKDVSGKAIIEARKIANMNTSSVNDNFSDAIAWSGVVYQAMAAEIYITRRIVKTIGKDGADGEELLLKHVMDEETGRLIEGNDLRGKKFQSYADAGPQYETLREQTVEDLKGMLEALGTTQAGQQYLPVLMSVLMDNISGVGLDPVKDFNRRIMLLQGLVKPNSPEEEKMLADAQAQQQEEDPNVKFLEAEAERALAEGRSLDASSLQKTADARKKAAETEKILADIPLSQAQLALQVEKQIVDQAQQGLTRQ